MAKTKTPKEKSPQDLLVEELENHYGVEFDGDLEKFIKDAVEASKDDARREQQDDPLMEAKYEGKIGELRALVAEESKPAKNETDRQKEIRKALEDADVKVALTFNDDETWHITNGGKEDSGHMQMPTSSIVAQASRLVGKSE